MAHGTIEIEIQVKVGRIEPLHTFLRAQATPGGERRQVDEYFSPTENSFVSVRPVREWLRLRTEGDTSSLNYKNWHYDAAGRSTHCDEYETVVNNPEAIRLTLRALHFQPLTTVDKTRTLWRYQDYEIALDHIQGLGDFVEIEYCGTTAPGDPSAVTAAMITWLKELGCGTITRNYVGYPFQLLFPNEIREETF